MSNTSSSSTFESSPIFIVGMPRSGTTLMSSLLAAHPQITIPLSETKFLCEWIKKDNDSNAPQDFDSFWNDYIHSERFSYLGIDANNVLQKILSYEDITYGNIFNSILDEYAEKMDKKRWGEKTPDHWRFADVLLDWYPKAKVIWIVRDPKGCSCIDSKNSLV